MWPPSSPTPASLIKYVQIADAPGRGEPGSGSIDWLRPARRPAEQRLHRPDRPRVLPHHRLGQVCPVDPGTGGAVSPNRYPARVDVAIVGSGPTASAYARILSEEAPGATIAMFEVGPTVSNPPGAHVKNIEDPERRSLAQRASEGPGAGRRDGQLTRRRQERGAEGPARNLPAAGRLRVPRRRRDARSCHVQQRGRHGRPLDCRLPAARRQGTHHVPAGSGAASRRRRTAPGRHHPRFRRRPVLRSGPRTPRGCGGRGARPGLPRAAHAARSPPAGGRRPRLVRLRRRHGGGDPGEPGV